VSTIVGMSVKGSKKLKEILVYFKSDVESTEKFG
jgi:hypothetical protein